MKSVKARLWGLRFPLAVIQMKSVGLKPWSDNLIIGIGRRIWLKVWYDIHSNEKY